MPYSAQISRDNPTLFVFLVDQSASMSDSVGSGAVGSKSNAVADTINRLIQNLALRSAKEDGVRDYFHLSVLGYGGPSGGTPALSGALRSADVVPLSQVADSPARIDERIVKIADGAGGLINQTMRFPIWLDPVANGGTPMTGALRRAYDVVEQFLRDHPNCYPPVVLNVTDGESTDGDPQAPAARLRTLASSDGDVLLFNLHLSSTNAPAVMFPHSETTLPDHYSRLLFNMSSELPPGMAAYAREQNLGAGEGARGFVFNADAVSLIQFFDIGTRVAIELR